MEVLLEIVPVESHLLKTLRSRPTRDQRRAIVRDAVLDDVVNGLLETFCVVFADRDHHVPAETQFSAILEHLNRAVRVVIPAPAVALIEGVHTDDDLRPAPCYVLDLLETLARERLAIAQHRTFKLQLDGQAQQIQSILAQQEFAPAPSDRMDPETAGGKEDPVAKPDPPLGFSGETPSIPLPLPCGKLDT